MTVTATDHVAGVDLLIGGAPIDQTFKDRLARVEVHSEIGGSDTAVVRITDPGAARIDTHPLTIGKELEVRLGGTGDRQTRSVFKGTITTLAPEFDQSGCTIAIRAHDHTPKLMANAHHRVFENQSFEEIVPRVASDAGLRQGRVDRGSGDRQTRVIQAGQSDYAFCRDLAAQVGWDFTVTGDAFDFTRRALGGTAVAMAYGRDLISFSPRASAIQQVAEVQVTSWDAATKRKITASASAPQLASSIGLSREDVANGDGGVLRIPDRPVASQGEAMAVAQGSLDEIAQGYLVADGVAHGIPALRAGVKVAVSGVGRHFSGEYLCSSVTHVFRGGKGYETRFTSRGRAVQRLGDLSRPTGPGVAWARGLVIGIVSNNNDPDKLGRVKVKYPSLDDMESEWAPVASLGAGRDRGVMMVPQQDEAVLVGFLHGDPDAPHVLGSLYNGRDVPGDELFQSKDGSFAVRSDRKLLLRSKEDLTLHTEKDMVVEVEGAQRTKVDRDLEQKVGGKVAATADGAVSHASSQSYTIEAGSSVTIKGSASVTIESQGSLALKGATVDITAQAAVSINGAIIKLG
jgi:uncharacterized protein involved in type VI secretion and phage assembly